MIQVTIITMPDGRTVVLYDLSQLDSAQVAELRRLRPDIFS
jgi:hypothetical protein